MLEDEPGGKATRVPITMAVTLEPAIRKDLKKIHTATFYSASASLQSRCSSDAVANRLPLHTPATLSSDTNAL